MDKKSNMNEAEREDRRLLVALGVLVLVLVGLFMVGMFIIKLATTIVQDEKDEK